MTITANTRPADGARGGAATRAGVIPRRHADTAPLSFAQQQIWLHAQLAPDLPLYNEQVTFRYRGALDATALARAFADLLARHEAWRTVFIRADDRVMQRILPPGVVEMPFVDLRTLPVAAREAEALRLARRDVQQSFDIATGPLVRPRLVRVGDDDSRVYLTLHHAVFDGYSLSQIALPELATLYAAAHAGTTAALPEPPIQYADWATWQRAEVERGAHAAQVDYWARRLRDVSPLDVPSDRPRPSAPSYRGGMHTFALPAMLAGRLRALAASERVTMYMLLVGVYVALLHRYTGNSDVTVGTVSAGRKRPQLARLLGFFANPMALRVDCADDPTFATLLRRVRDVALDALANDDLPFEHVVAALQPARDAGRHPFFQSVVALEAPLARAPEGWDLWNLDVHTGTSKFDLYLELHDRRDGLYGSFVYATDLFDAETIARMAGHYANLLEGAIQDPTRRLSALPMLDAAERRRVLVDWARAPDASPAGTTVHSLVEAHAARTPDAVAVEDGTTRLTYAQLDAHASALARRLRAAGVERDVVVGLHGSRSPSMVAAMLGVLKAGGAYLPLDPALPAERLRVMADDARCRVLVDDRAAPRVEFSGVEHVIRLDSIAAGEREPGTRVGADALAFVMYTSGSTGRPKGVALPHRGVVRLLLGQSYVRFAADETFLHLSATTFDAATFEVWGALLHGARCVVLPGGVPTPRGVRDAVRAHGVTTALLTTAFFNAVVDELPEALTGLRQIVIGGEAMSAAHVARAAAAMPGTRFVNAYGPTECTTIATCHVVWPPLDPALGPVPIGRPIAGTEVYVLDAHGGPVAIGVPGELHLGGAGLARGYLHRPDLTAERFVRHPFDPAPDARLYRTGDLVRWRPDATLEYLGRLDAQVKIRGVRVEPAEVEAMLSAYPAVRDVAVLATAGERPNDVRLVAYVVPAAGSALTSATLREHVHRRLPAAFVPSAFVLLDALPLAPTGKLDRRALPAPGREPRALVRTRGPLQLQLAEVWRELLGVPDVGATDDFFELGGHSLLAVRMLQRVHELYGASLPLAVLYTDPTIKGLSEALLASEPAEFQAPLVRLREGGTRPPLFLFHGDLNGGGFYSLRLARRLAGDRAFWVVHPFGLRGRAGPVTIEAMARVHAEQLQAAQPDGPLVLGGYCNGGHVAYETARLLTARGRRIERLVLIATDADTRFRTLWRPIAAAARALGLGAEGAVEQFGRVRHFADRIREMDAAAAATFVLRSAAHVARQLARRVGRSLPAQPEIAPRLAPLIERYYDAVYGYIPAPWPGHVIVFWPEAERPARADDPSLGWGALVDRVEAYRIPGDHDEIVTRHIERVAATLESCLP